MRIFWNARMNHWRIWGIWIREKWFIGFSIVDEVEHE